METKMFEATIRVNKNCALIKVVIPALTQSNAWTQARRQYAQPEYLVIGVREL